MLAKQKSGGLFIAWTRFQRRQISMQTFFGFEPVFIDSPRTARLPKLLRYAVQFGQTMGRLIRARPRVVWVQLPPLPILSAALLYRVFVLGRCVVVADCHNAMLRAPWVTLPTAVWQLNRADIVLVHNEEQLAEAGRHGIRSRSLLVLEDAPANLKSSGEQFAMPGRKRPWVLFPASYGMDEPIEEVIAAARLLPDITLIITGDPARAKRKVDIPEVPDNVWLSGYLSSEDFNRLFLSADVVLGLTRFDGVQLSVCNEAVGTGKPMVLSGTRLLRTLFPVGSVFLDSSAPSAIATACRRALAEKDELTRQMLELRATRLTSWRDGQARVVAERLGARYQAF